MRSPLGAVLGAVSQIANRSPIPHVSRTTGTTTGMSARNDIQSQLRAMYAVGTLFAIVDRNALSTAQCEWELWRSAKSGKEEDRTQVAAHAALDLWEQPNQFMTGEEFREAGQQHYELVGEKWWVIARMPGVSLPLEMWPVRPDRMTPIPHPEKYLVGYEYTGPGGEKIPLKLDEVIFQRRPNTLDPYRGAGPVQAILADIDSERYSAEWNRNFFINSAEPGGVVELDRSLNDRDFAQMVTRWQEQHKGVARAHRVAILERGKWVDRKYTQKDMQFAELRKVAREVIMEAFGFPKFLLGIVEDVNRANAEASEVMYARWLTVPRLRKERGSLNTRLLPMYGTPGRGLEFDFINPVPEDREADNAELTAKVNAAHILIQHNFDKQDVLRALDLPDIALAAEPVAEPPAPPAPPPPAEPAPGQPAEQPEDQPAAPSVEDLLADLRAGSCDPDREFNRLLAGLAPARPADRPAAPRAADDDSEPELDELPPGVDLDGLQQEWLDALDALLAAWDDVLAEQYDTLVRQVREAVEAGNMAALSTLTAPDSGGAQLLTDAMVALAELSAARAAAEAAEQDVEVEPAVPTAETLAAVAAVAAGILATGVALSAAREALRVAYPGADAERVAEQVREHLDALTDAQPRLQLGGALSDAQHQGRTATMRAAEQLLPDLSEPSVAYYASEKLDEATCRYCREVDKRWLGNSLDDVMKEYPGGGYVRCEGRWRCRGQVVAVWRGGEDQSQWIEKEPVTHEP